MAHDDARLFLVGKGLSSMEMVDAAAQYVNAEEIEVQGTAVAIAGSDWLVVAERPMAEILRVSNEQKKVLYQLLLFSILVTLGMLYLFMTYRINRPLLRLAEGTKKIGEGEFNEPIPISSEDELGRLSEAFNSMSAKLEHLSLEEKRVDWLKSGLSGLDEQLRGVVRLDELANKSVSFVANYLNAQVGAFYALNEEGLFALAGGYAFTAPSESTQTFAPGQGLVARDGTMLEVADLPEGYSMISSGLGSLQPESLLLLPLIHNEEVVGVLELGGFKSFTEEEKALLVQASTVIAVSLMSAQNRNKLRQALEKSQSMSEELQTQQEELRTLNEELEEQTQQLQASEEQLRSQEEELRAANEELHEKAQLLEEQQEHMASRNSALQVAQKMLEEKSRNLEISSRYKSEFLANMSHELRTPLNSLLILSRDLMFNKGGKLDADQVESAEVINQSGKDLLNLINEILDLSKIEAGKMTLSVDEVPFVEIKNRLTSNFRHMAEEKGLEYKVDIEKNLPEKIMIDPQRLDQVLKNLLSNAIKFTENGSVQVRIFRPDGRQDLSEFGLNPQSACGISITDTGVGIPEGSLAEIFEDFKQVDGTISRRFGGTGLGLTISRQLVALLGGHLQVVSEEGKGSTLTLFLPLQYVEPTELPDLASSPPQPAPLAEPTFSVQTPAVSIADDRADIEEADRHILIVEDDPHFAKILAKLCHEKGFKFLHAADGETGLRLMEENRLDAIFLDIKLPGMNGLVLLDYLKNNPELRHIPVHIMSVEESSVEALQQGAIGFLQKPIERESLDQAFQRIEKFSLGKLRRLLIVEDDLNQQKSIIKLIGNGDVEMLVASSGKEAMEILQARPIDCMILDLKLADMTGFELLRQLEEQEELEIPPIIVYTGKELSREEVEMLRQYTSSIIVKGVQSPERLLDEASLFLHRVVSSLPDQKRQMITSLYNSDEIFVGRKVLLVDDDMRNVFALSKMLGERGFNVFKAANGQKALDLLEAEPEIGLVLMDIMMPVMDGYEAMRLIRKQPRFARLPIIALTAKAMSEDRAHSIAAGANDYMTKPVDVERLLSLLRIWLQR